TVAPWMDAIDMTIHDLVNGVDCVLFDVDGPICSVFARVPAPQVAALLSSSLRDDGIPDHIATSTDPLAVLVYAAGRGRAEDSESMLAEVENRAIETAEPTPGADAALSAARRSGRIIGFVSNNSAVAVARYLAARGLIQPGDLVSARTAAAVGLMKPDPFYVR